MSGRAVRKALRQREAQLAEPTPDASSSSEDDSAAGGSKPSIFALLAEADAAQAADNDSDDEQEEEEEIDAPGAPGSESVARSAAQPSKRKGKKKKKKAKAAKGKEKSPPPESTGKENGDDDEIDAALRELNLQRPPEEAETTRGEGRAQAKLAEVLKVDTRNLDAGNEMRKLFGRAAQAMGDDEQGAGQGGARMRAGRGRGRMMGIPGAVGGRGLTSGRRNAFIQPKEDWPNAGSGGLGMEVVSDSVWDSREGITEFRFVHSKAYQDVQRQFMICVASMDPDRLIHLLQHNPYHVSTLLQVSEILTAQRDHTLSGDLLERALFTLGRSLHSSFAPKLADGRARLSFSRPENREFFLAVWRYIKNLTMRGTWRTAHEWARMLLSMDPVNDPYQLCLLLDVLALKAHQPELLLALADADELRPKFADLPSIAFSAALAQKMLGRAEVAREYLAKAITRFPWMPAMLYPELGVDRNLPPALWGLRPPEANPKQQLLATLYLKRAVELWKDPAATELLVDVASTIYSLPRKPLIQPDDQENVSRALARHVLLTDEPAVTTLLPRHWTRQPTSSFDPLPPTENVESYSAALDIGGLGLRGLRGRAGVGAAGWGADGAGGVAAEGGVGGEPGENRSAVWAFLRSMLPWIQGEDFEDAPEEVLLRVQEELEARGVLLEEGWAAEDAAAGAGAGAGAMATGNGGEATEAGQGRQEGGAGSEDEGGRGGGGRPAVDDGDLD